MPYQYPAIFTRQRAASASAPIVATFAAPAKDLLEWTTINQLTVGGPGHQRIRNEAKVRAISRFLRLDDHNSIPTALIVAIRGVQDVDAIGLDTCATLVIPDAQEPPGLVIDGQHRLFGIDEFDPDMPINVVALINPSDDEIAFQFLVINNKATKVSTDHVKLLGLNYEESALTE
jgi:DGQHR domain-containing protein